MSKQIQNTKLHCNRKPMLTLIRALSFFVVTVFLALELSYYPGKLLLWSYAPHWNNENNYVVNYDVFRRIKI